MYILQRDTLNHMPEMDITRFGKYGMVNTVVRIRSQRSSSQDRAQEKNQAFAEESHKSSAWGGGKQHTVPSGETQKKAKPSGSLNSHYFLSRQTGQVLAVLRPRHMAEGHCSTAARPQTKHTVTLTCPSPGCSHRSSQACRYRIIHLGLT